MTLKDKMNALRDEAQTQIKAMLIDGYSHAEIADIVGCSLSYVSQTAQRMKAAAKREDLAQQLQGMVEGTQKEEQQ